MEKDKGAIIVFGVCSCGLVNTYQDERRSKYRLLLNVVLWHGYEQKRTTQRTN